MEEKHFHDLVLKKQSIQKAILSSLDIHSDKYKFIHEDQYPNGLFADFTLLVDGKVKAIFELKGSEIGVNDFVRGIGQIMQYQHFADENMSLKGYKYENAFAVYMLPSSIFRNTKFNIGLFKYPEKAVLLELNEVNSSVRVISENERKNLATAVANKISICQYYIRDTRLYEIYLCLKYCQYQKICGTEKINRRIAETDFLRQLETKNNNNWRNVFISLASLGLIDSNNLPTDVGNSYAAMSFGEFCYEMYNSYIKEYINELIEALLKINSTKEEQFEASNETIKKLEASCICVGKT